jgi:hypothetical protein
VERIWADTFSGVFEITLSDQKDVKAIKKMSGTFFRRLNACRQQDA